MTLPERERGEEGLLNFLCYHIHWPALHLLKLLIWLLSPNPQPADIFAGILLPSMSCVSLYALLVFLRSVSFSSMREAPAAWLK